MSNSLTVFCFLGFLFVCLFCFLGPHLQQMEVPRLGVWLELQLPAYTTDTAMQDPSWACDLHHSSQQHRILNSLSEARDQTRVFKDTSWVLNPLSHSGNSWTSSILNTLLNRTEPWPELAGPQFGIWTTQLVLWSSRRGAVVNESD